MINPLAILKPKPKVATGESHFPNAYCPECYTRGIWNLPCGTATGRFRNRGDLGHGFFPGILTCIEEQSARQGTLIFSAPGFGKTRAGILPKIRAALAADAQTGAIIPAIKANLVYQAIALAKQTGHPYKVFAVPGSLPDTITLRDGTVEDLNLSTMAIWGPMSPDAIGESYRDALGASENEFWRSAPASLTGNYSRMLRGLGDREVTIPGPILKGPDGKQMREDPTQELDEDGVPVFDANGMPKMSPGQPKRGPEKVLKLSYSPHGLHQSIFAPDEAVPEWMTLMADERVKIDELLYANSNPLTDEELQDPDAVTAWEAAQLSSDELLATEQRARDLEGAWLYFDGPFTRLVKDGGTDTLTNVVHTLEPYLSALVSDPRLRGAFVTGDEMNVCALADKGTVCIIYINVDEYPSAARLIPNLLIRQVAAFAGNRLKTRGYKHPFLLVLDEYGTFAAAEHVGPLEKVRESNIIVIASAISISNLGVAVKSENAALAIVACFSSLQVFGLNDERTKKYVKDRAGSVNIMRRSSTPGTGPVRDHWHRLQRYAGQDTSYNFSPTPQPVVADEDFADLGVSNGQAKAILFTPNAGEERRDMILCPIETNKMLGLPEDDDA